jgi:anti-sigma regulatory factor (Ser/Thr protein kinase)
MTESYLKLGCAAALPVVLSAILYFLIKRTPLGRRVPRIAQQIVIGVLFGALACLGTHWGINIDGAMVNCRDAAVLTAGLMFGGPAGIIAGIIGGVERVIATVVWDIGSFTVVACSVSTAIAGFYAAALRRYMFEDKKPGWLISLAIGVVMEVFHLTMVFVTNMADTERAMEVVKACTVPMLTANGVSVMLSAMVISLIAHEKLSQRTEHVRISQKIQRELLVTVAITFVLTSVFVALFQNSAAKAQADKYLAAAIDEVSSDVEDATGGEVSGYTVNEVLRGLTKNRHVGETGYTVILNDKYEIVNAPDGFKIESLDSQADILTASEEGKTFKMTIDGETVLSRAVKKEGYAIISILPEREAMKTRNVALYVNTFMEILVFALMFAFIYLVIKRAVVNQIKKINGSLAKITGGNLNEVVNVRSSEEFASLSDDINSTVTTLKGYISEAERRMEKELEFAKTIQHSALPSVFPAFPGRDDFDVFASMDTAKEVGGDFYDFYLKDDGGKLAILAADVSGKGIPAAMFMMRAKTQLKNLTESGIPVSEVFTKANDALCTGNDAGMFVTAWEGIVDLSSGKMKFSNAGHNPPMIKRAGGHFSPLRSKPSLVLAGMEGIKYREEEALLSPGDTLFLYTDGVTEATDKDGELFGESRLISALNGAGNTDAKGLCDAVKAALDAFVGDADQFDDITMLSLIYRPEKVYRMTVRDAALSDIDGVTEFIEKNLEDTECPIKTIYKLNVAADEIFSNIVKHAYPDSPGDVDISFVCDREAGCVTMSFADSGEPYDPTQTPDPDVSLSAEERPVGGLGIFVVKRTMDSVLYERKDGKNVLTVVKKFDK